MTEAGFLERAKQDRFAPFTRHARKALLLGQEEAQRFGHDSVTPEHLLLGLIKQGECTASRILRSLHLELFQIRQEIERRLQRIDRQVPLALRLAPRTRRMLELAAEEARQIRSPSVGTEHLLLGVLREGGDSATVLESLDVGILAVRQLAVQSTRRTEEQSSSDVQPTGGDGPESSTFTLSLDDQTLDLLDLLVEAGLQPTHSEVVAWLFHSGIGANEALIAQLHTMASEIHALRDTF
jgi:ATP-dependent Clp protease ATP-binding subunit ClpC